MATVPTVVVLEAVCALPARYARRTVMRLVVSVPVLSEQMVVAEPMVSHASMCLTMQLSSCMRRTEKESESVTARGSPSGTATTRMAMPSMKKERILDGCLDLSQDSLPLWKVLMDQMMDMPTTQMVATIMPA